MLSYLYDYFSLIPSSSLLIILFTFLTSLVVAYNIMSIFFSDHKPYPDIHKNYYHSASQNRKDYIDNSPL